MKEKINRIIASPLGVSVGLAALIVGSLWLRPLIFAAVLLNAVAFVRFKDEDAYKILFFVMPFAAIYKYPGIDTSFLTVLELLLVIVVLMRRRRINAHTVIAVLFITGYFALRMGGYYMGIVKLVLGFALVYTFILSCRREQAGGIAEFLTLGMLISSILGYFKETIPTLLEYFGDVNYEFIDGEKTLRFSGLYVDPNYFSVVLIAIMAFLVILKHYRGYSPVKFWLTFASLATLGFLTYSKSFVLMFALVLLFEVLINLRTRKPWLSATVILLIAALAVLFLSGRVAVFERMFTRLGDEDVLTGRDDIWANYLEVIRSSPLNIIFGVGLDAPYVGAKAAHNMYIELVYYSGVLGLMAYMLGWVYLILSDHRGRARVLPFIVPVFVFAMYTFICGFLDHSLPFMVMLSWMAAEAGCREAAGSAERRIPTADED